MSHSYSVSYDSKLYRSIHDWSIRHPIETQKLSHEDVTLDYTLMRQGNHGYAEQSKKPPKEGGSVVI